MGNIRTIEQTAQAASQIHAQMDAESGFEVDQLVSQPVLIHYYCTKTGRNRAYVLAVSPISNPYLPTYYQPSRDNRECKAQDDRTDNSSASQEDIDNSESTESQNTDPTSQRQEVAQSFSKVPGLTFDLNEHDVQNWLAELEAYQAIYAPYYKRREQREHSANYLHGLLSPIDDKSVENIVLSLFGAKQNIVRNMQHFLSNGAWDDEAILKRHWQEVNQSIGDEDGVLTVDGSDFPKQGSDSVGVQRQYCGQLGKIANCQAGVFVGYVAKGAYCLLDRRLYLPKSWLTDQMAKKREQCGVPEEVVFQTKPELALESLKAINAEGTLSASWVTCDEAFGHSTLFLDGVAGLGLWYFAEVSDNTRVWEEPVRVEVPPYCGHGKKPTKLKVVEGEAPALTVSQIANSIGYNSQKMVNCTFFCLIILI